MYYISITFAVWGWFFAFLAMILLGKLSLSIQVLLYLYVFCVLLSLHFIILYFLFLLNKVHYFFHFLLLRLILTLVLLLQISIRVLLSHLLMSLFLMCFLDLWKIKTYDGSIGGSTIAILSIGLGNLCTVLQMFLCLVPVIVWTKKLDLLPYKFVRRVYNRQSASKTKNNR